MKRGVWLFLSGLGIGVFGTMLLLTIGATAQTKIIEEHYESALHTSFNAYDELYALHRQLLLEVEQQAGGDSPYIRGQGPTVRGMGTPPADSEGDKDE